MSSTTVHSNIAGTEIKVTEKELELPPKANLFVEIGSYVEEQGEIIIPAENGVVTKQNLLVTSAGKEIPMNKDAYQKIEKNRNARRNSRSKNVEINR